MEFQRWGITHYDDAVNRQLDLVLQRIQSKIPNTVVFTEHFPVFTIGSRKNAFENLLWSSEKLETEGIKVHTSNRGGDVTYHGPGQLICYPILSLEAHKDLHAYLRFLEQIIIHVLTAIGLNAVRRSGKTGIWIDDRKIAAIGVAVKRWVTYHGFSLNVNNDLSPYAGIVPCGIAVQEGSVTSIREELGHELDLSDVICMIRIEFTKLFSV